MKHIANAPTAKLLAPRLEVQDLRVAMALAQAKTTAAAAELLHITQSAVSRALAVAETHAGIALFTRTSQGLVPTAAGIIFLERAPGLLAEFSALERRLREPAPRAARLRFVAECHAAYPWLARVVLRLRRSNPEIALRMPVRHSYDAVQALTQEKIDAAMTTSALPAGLRFQPLFEDELLFVLAQEHPAAQQETLEPEDLKTHGLLTPDVSTQDLWFMRKVFGRSDTRLNVERFGVTEAMMEFARAGLGIAVVSEWVADAYLSRPGAGLVAVRLGKGPLKRRWRLAYREEVAGMVAPLAEAVLAARPVRAR